MTANVNYTEFEIRNRELWKWSPRSWTVRCRISRCTIFFLYANSLWCLSPKRRSGSDPVKESLQRYSGLVSRSECPHRFFHFCASRFYQHLFYISGFKFSSLIIWCSFFTFTLVVFRVHLAFLIKSKNETITVTRNRIVRRKG